MGDRDQSLVGHSEADAPDADRGFATRDDDRYREVRVVGSGGLGTVLLAHDQRLDREVALKRIGPGADERSAAARFAREARITARLDHPGIVPIHDAGVTADGRLFYTMRLIRGRSLGELAGEARDLDARLALVPALTAACHAVGHAHRRGIVHRDLKPANVMVGDAGETQVVDWGLAEELAVLALTAGAGIVGTPAYLSPEVARGEPAGCAADVWALGATLHEVLSGERHRRGDREQVLAALRRAPEPLRWPDGVPAELRAIAEHAMADVPAARYVDAEAMAADLEAYRDGRRVQAHDYSAAELAWRALVALRWPLAIFVALVVAVIASLALTANRTERQRVRAVAAEQVAARDRDRAEDALAQAIAAAAVSALEDGRAAHAEILAAYALQRAESPDARGVLAATTAGLRPTIERVDLPGCDRVLSAGGDLAFCHLADRLELWELSPPRRRWQQDLRVAGAVALASQEVIAWTVDGELLGLAAADGAPRSVPGGFRTAAAGVVDFERTRAVFHDGHDVLVVVSADDTRRGRRPCGDDGIAAATATPRAAWVVCGRGAVLAVEDRGATSHVIDTPFGVDLRPASALALGEGQFSVAIGGLGGDVLIHDLRGCFHPSCEDLPRDSLYRGVTTHAIRAIAEVGNAAVVVADDGDAVIVGRQDGRDHIALPVDGPRTVEIDEVGIITGGRQWRRWSFEQAGSPRRFQVPAGLTVAAVSPDGNLIAADGERGLITVRSLDGRNDARLDVGRGGVAALAFSPDGGRLTVTHARGGVSTWATADWRRLSRVEAPPPPPPALPDDPTILATARSADGRWLATATRSGRVDVHELPSRRLVARLHGHRQRATWVTFHGKDLWSGGWDGELLRWNIAAFTEPAAELRAAAEATWRLTLDEVLGRAPAP